MDEAPARDDTDEAKKKPLRYDTGGAKSGRRLEPSRCVGNDGYGDNGNDGHGDHIGVGVAREIRRAG